MYRIRFFDGAGTEVFIYNPTNYNNACIKHQIAENEEIIGVYGVKTHPDYPDIAYFHSFGFIVKVKQPI